MRVAENNPLANILGAGISDDQVSEAVEKSGYPLQYKVASLLRPLFWTQEEWSFLDRQTGELRTTDLLATRPLFEYEKWKGTRIRPELNLIIECKQSQLPYVFFLSKELGWVSHFPMFAGLFQHDIELTTDDDPSTWTLPLLQVLDMEEHPFVKEVPAFSTLFSKTVRKGEKLELSGTEAFQGLVLPLLKALHHFSRVHSPSETAMYFDCHMVLGLGVLDAPMVAVRMTDAGYQLEMVPWVRVVRHEGDQLEDWPRTGKLYAIDIVHKDFLVTFVEQHLLPFAQTFSERALLQQRVLASGKGFVSGLGKGHIHDLETRLQPRHLQAKATRGRLFVSSVLGFLTRRRS